MPAPPDYASPPPLWGSEQHVRRLFSDSPIELAFARGYNPWRFDFAEHFVAFMETYYGPTLKARERLTAEGRWQDCRAEIVALAERHNEATDGTLLMKAEYLVVVGRQRARRQAWRTTSSTRAGVEIGFGSWEETVRSCVLVQNRDP